MASNNRQDSVNMGVTLTDIDEITNRYPVTEGVWISNNGFTATGVMRILSDGSMKVMCGACDNSSTYYHLTDESTTPGNLAPSDWQYYVNDGVNNFGKPRKDINLRKGVRHSKETKTEAVKLFNKGASITYIADKFSASIRSIRRWTKASTK